MTVMSPDMFDEITETWKADLVKLVTALQADIGDEYRIEGQDDDKPTMQITIATDDECSGWVYQTGDNSYSGACYTMPYWGIGYITRDCKPEDVVEELLSDLGEQWASNPANAHGW